MDPNEPLVYAHFYKLSEDPGPQTSLDLAGSCEPQSLIMPEGLAPVNAEERLKKVDRLFHVGIMTERLLANEEDAAALKNYALLKRVTGNVWRGLLPTLKTSDLVPVPVLHANGDERRDAQNPTAVQPQSDAGPSESAASSFPGVPGQCAADPTISVEPSAPVSTDPGASELDELTYLSEAILAGRVDFFQSSPSPAANSPITHVTVPSGPDVPTVPSSLREVFDQYNSSPASNADQQPQSSGNVITEEILLPENVNCSGVSVSSDNGPGFQDNVSGSEFKEIPSFSDIVSEEGLALQSSLQSAQNTTQSGNSLFDEATIENLISEEVSSDFYLQSISSVFTPDLTKSKAHSTGTSVENLSQEVKLVEDVKQEEKDCSNPRFDTVRIGEGREFVAKSEGKINQIKSDPSNVVCSTPTLQAGDQILSYVAILPMDATKSNVMPNSPRGQISETVEQHVLSVDEKWQLCAAKEREFCQRVEDVCPVARMRQQLIEFQEATCSVNLTMASATSDGAFTGLGSLSVFMQTRGTNEKAGSSSQSLNMSILASGSGGPSGSEGDSNVPPTPPTPKPALGLVMRVTQAAFDPPHIIFLSHSLHRSHAQFIQFIEGWRRPPLRLIYREYYQPFAEIICPFEADIIVAPETGVILATPFALTQRYPPGHRPTETVDGVVSPLREQIWRLATRYENLYVLICEPNGSAASASTARHHLLNELPALYAFCQTLINMVSITLAPIKDHPATIMMWCFGLGRIYLSSHSLQFSVFAPQETESERILRSRGLNPFAARVILDDIQRSRIYPSHQNSWLSSSGDEMGALDSLLTELKRSETKQRYRPLIGARVFDRFRGRIE